MGGKSCQSSRASINFIASSIDITGVLGSVVGLDSVVAMTACVVAGDWREAHRQPATTQTATAIKTRRIMALP